MSEEQLESFFQHLMTQPYMCIFITKSVKWKNKLWWKKIETKGTRLNERRKKRYIFSLLSIFLFIIIFVIIFISIVSVSDVLWMRAEEIHCLLSVILEHLNKYYFIQRQTFAVANVEKLGSNEKFFIQTLPWDGWREEKEKI